jgi:hypothetical protein
MTQTYNIARHLVRPVSTAGGAHRLIFTNQVSIYNYNKYVPGSGVGGLNRSVRRALNRNASFCNGTTSVCSNPNNNITKN